MIDVFSRFLFANSTENAKANNRTMNCRCHYRNAYLPSHPSGQAVAIPISSRRRNNTDTRNSNQLRFHETRTDIRKTST